LFLLENENPPDWVNLGTGTDHSIQEIANLVKEVVGYDGKISNDLSKPDGMPLKRLDVSLAEKLGWKAKIPLEEGLLRTYGEFCDSLANNTARL
jgi:GDP-L-fucose synthase